MKIPGATYTVNGTVYVSLTNECTAELTTHAANGPSFSLPDGFKPLPDGTEPTGEQAGQLALKAISKTKEKEADVVFEGKGEPLARVPELIAALKYLGRNSKRFQKVKSTTLNTNGLVKEQNATQIVTFLREAGLQKACVQLQTADAAQYQDMVGPLKGLHHSDVCAFVTALASGGIETHVSAVEKPGVDLAAVEALATELGAKHFVKKPYFE